LKPLTRILHCTNLRMPLFRALFRVPLTSVFFRIPNYLVYCERTKPRTERRKHQRRLMSHPVPICFALQLVMLGSVGVCSQTIYQPYYRPFTSTWLLVLGQNVSCVGEDVLELTLSYSCRPGEIDPWLRSRMVGVQLQLLA